MWLVKTKLFSFTNLIEANISKKLQAYSQTKQTALNTWFKSEKDKLQKWAEKDVYEKTADYNERMQGLPAKQKQLQQNLAQRQQSLQAKIATYQKQITQSVFKMYHDKHIKSIAWKDYKSFSTEPVDYAIRDAQMMRKYLLSLGFEDHHIFYQENATRNDFVGFFGDEDHLGTIHDYATSSEREAFIFISGMAFRVKRGRPTFFRTMGFVKIWQGRLILIRGSCLWTMWPKLRRAKRRW